MKKQLRPLIILAAALVLIVGAYLVGTQLVPRLQKPQETTESSTGEALKPILETDFESVSYLEVENPSGSYRLIPERGEDEEGESIWIWSVDGYPGYPFSKDSLTRLASVASEAFVKQELDQPSEDLSVYGLDQPQSLLRVVHRSGQSHEIRFGNLAPSDNYLYATLDETGRVCLIGKSLSERTQASVMDLLDKDQVIGFSLEELTGLTFKRDKDDLHLVASALLVGDMESDATFLEFTIEAPLQRDANSDNLGKLAHEVMGLTIDSFVELEPDALAAYGLDQPAYVFELQAHNQAVTVSLGDPGPSNTYYAQSSQLPAVFTVSSQAFSVLDLKLTEMIDRFVALESIWTVSRIEADLMGTQFDLDIQMEEGQNASDDGVVFRMNGQDARIMSERKKSLFSSFYQRLISLYIDGVETDIKPENTKDGSLVFHLKADADQQLPQRTLNIEFAKRNQYTDYVFINGSYAGFYVDHEKAFTSDRLNNEGILTAYKQMAYAMEHAVDGVFNTEEGYQLD